MAEDFDFSLFEGGPGAGDLGNDPEPETTTTPPEDGGTDKPDAPVTEDKEVPTTPVLPDAEVTEEELESESETLTPRELALMKRLEQVTGERLSQPSQPSKETTPTSSQTQEPLDFIGDDDLDEIFSTKEGINKLLNSLYQKVLEASATASTERTMQGLPQVVTTYIARHMEMKQIVDQFYSDNPDLSQVKKTVGMVANEIAMKNPSMSREDVFKNTAIQTRRLLRLKTPTTPQKKQRPAFAGQRRAGGGRPTQVNGAKELVDEISELLS